ncbi:MAG: hypothetical protein AAF620_19945 [Bacteroidota bacterium]
MTVITNGGSETFIQYLNSIKDQVKKDSSDGYYHVDIVADAYSQGYQDGQKSGKKDFIKKVLKERIERFTQTANQVYILTSKLVSVLKDSDYDVVSFHIDLNTTCPRSLIVVDIEILNDDKFVYLAYSTIKELKDVFKKIFADSMLDMSIIGSENLEYSLLSEDGFGYSEAIKPKNAKKERTRKKK